jgi:hypothetical protein
MRQLALSVVQVGLLVGGAACATAPVPEDALWKTFQAPPGEARASCYWWWKGDLTAGEMGRQLHLLKDAGLGGAHIIPWSSKPAYLTPEWLNLLRAASDAARNEGMILDISANAGWPFRGDWVPAAESLQKIALETFQLSGPTTFLPPKRSTSKAKGKPKDMFTDGGILLAQLAPDTASQIEDMREVTADLTRADSPGVAVPAGKHTLRILRLLKELKTKAEWGRVPDHFNPQAMEHYLKGFADRVAPALGGKLSNGFRALYCDSNGQLLGPRWYGQHDYAVASALKPEENQLEVKLITTLFNCVRKKTEHAVPSGLIGPVVIQTSTSTKVP